MNWKNITKIWANQIQKGHIKYGRFLEEDTDLTIEQKMNHLNEELVDALMYMEHLKQSFKEKPTNAKEICYWNNIKELYEKRNDIIHSGLLYDVYCEDAIIKKIEWQQVTILKMFDNLFDIERDIKNEN